MVDNLRPRGIEELRRALGRHVGPAERWHRLLSWLDGLSDRWDERGSIDAADLERLEREALPRLNALLTATESEQGDLIAGVCEVRLP